MAEKERADVALVKRGLCESREKAQANIMAGLVYIGQRKVLKAIEEGILTASTKNRMRELEDEQECALRMVHSGEAALLGAKDVLAIDIDPTAVKVARENIEHNHLSDKIRAVEGNLLEKTAESCDVCVANIIADVICFFAKPLTSHIVPGGKFICSGIIKERENDVVAALTEAGYTIEEIRRKGEWVAIRAGRN